MKYTPATVAKAIVAFVVSASGALATSGVALDQLTTGTVLGALGVGLTAAAAVFVTPNKPTDVTSVSDQIVANLPVVVDNVTDAVNELNKVRQAATDVLGSIPVVGPLAEQVIDSIPRLR